MMDFDYRAKRLENEQKKMKEAAKRKLQQEKLQLEKQQERERELAEHRQKQEELKEKIRLEQEMIELHEAQLTNGITYQKQFQQFYEIQTNETEIGDKITLSEDCLVELTNLDVFQKSSAVNFQLEIFYRLVSQSSSANTSVRRMITYCGINEFTAPKETIGLSPKIVDTIRLHSGFNDVESEEQYFNPFTPPFPTTQTSNHSNTLKPTTTTPSPSENILSNTPIQIISIQLRYMKLPKCTYIKLKPKFHDFYHIEAVKRCLEENLSFHTSITLNDLLLIKYRGDEFPLLVTDVKPERYGSLLNTDVEVDFDYSEEYEQKKKEEQAKNVAAPIEPLPSSLTTSVGQKLGSSETASEPMAVAADNEELWTLLKSATMKEEPLITGENKNSYLQAKFKLMNGKSLMRKFLYDETLLDIYTYVIQELQKQNGIKDHEVPSLQLSISNPTKTFLINDIASLTRTLNELELNVKSQLFFVSLH